MSESGNRTKSGYSVTYGIIKYIKILFFLFYKFFYCFLIFYPMCHWNRTIFWLDCQALADHATPKLQSRIATFTSTFIFQFNTFFDRVWFANNQLCKRYILIHIWLNLAHNWLCGVALKSGHAIWSFAKAKL